MFVPRGRQHGVLDKELPAVLGDSAAHWGEMAQEYVTVSVRGPGDPGEELGVSQSA